ncbi:MAG: hypothetical protein NT159_07500 [Proteobacteria bacterium]|nr:hypothetical protein [Pseudomonadota bacterium]
MALIKTILKVLGFAVTIVAVVSIGSVLFYSLIFGSDPPTIVDYSPSAFAEKGTNPFFYSIGIDPKDRNSGVDLRYADHFDPKARILFSGSLRTVIPSPDNAKALVVSNSVLWVVGIDGTAPQRVADVGEVYLERKPLGKQFFRHGELQWSADSSKVYLIKDEYYESKGSQVFSKKGELYEYDLATRQLKPVVSPFRAFRYLVVDGSGIFYIEPTEQGSLTLKVHRSAGIADVDSVSRNAFAVEGKEEQFAAVPFYSFSLKEYADDILPSLGVKLSYEKGPKNRIANLYIRDKKVLSVHEVQGAKGMYIGIHSMRSTFLPGDRYFLA